MQQPGEPDEAFARFLFYRNLGPCRSLANAYKAYCAEHGEPASASLPGSWGKESSANGWVDRARAWDLHALRTCGYDVATVYVEALRSTVRRLLRNVENIPAPASWGELVETLATLNGIIGPLATEVLSKGELPAVDADVPRTPGASQPPARKVGHSVGIEEAR